jgi:hypothetical protein
MDDICSDLAPLPSQQQGLTALPTTCGRRKAWGEAVILPSQDIVQSLLDYAANTASPRSSWASRRIQFELCWLGGGEIVRRERHRGLVTRGG